MFRLRWLIALVAVVALVAAACGDDEEEVAPEGEGRAMEAPEATITVDGDNADWADIEGMDLTLEAIEGENVEPRAATIKIAHDDEFVYALLEVEDDYNWDAADPHFSGSPSVMWAIESGAAPHMGAEQDDLETSLGMVDIWHWELECAAGEQSGGAVSGPGDGDPGNDEACNFDDEWSTIPEEREDDLAEGAENSLLGVWNHTNPTTDGEGTWIFEMSRPLTTGDEQDAEFAVGDTALMALAYWDADSGGPEGWDDDDHAQSSNQGWIEVTLV